MPLELVTVPCLKDNYAYLVHDAETGETALIDAPEAGAIAAVLEDKGWTLSHVLLTHHHWDHIDGLTDLLKDHPAKVIGAKIDAHRLPPLDRAVVEGDTLIIGSEAIQVIDVSGHTIGHIAFYFPESKLAFTADSLMALGCGRLFEGTPDQMFDSLSKLATLPADTMICSGHEYTQSNGKFALTIDPDNPALISRMRQVQTAREQGEATVPSMLSEELATNPFLRCNDPGIKASVGMIDAQPSAVFAEIRKRKDNF
ncbi:Hydroxyacylglutathione hydrolase [Thalassovita gelatinovora]|uniref:Hydroxyacylglutathione hydrolase n=1 Tax=Thalassovita gelatinovora TaxID=53501 RepID=A0A0P1F8N2_THAGE|nr:hydroxyacylglutathione hydrolase [Thalassovita gelatinovora]QIZ81355.1 hydroxyacylglutathione hydrolase [Thalassovita gelatinovora]CUH64453.1 Hydroxyacylglutathione hydrolase [Thalassovita gelatinovora]SEP98422.1 hydroxyacylglutathione hydrolase [Thalassovita gelatinovora]